MNNDIEKIRENAIVMDDVPLISQLPYISILWPISDAVQTHEFKSGQFCLNNETELGKAFRAFIVARRLRALEFEGKDLIKEAKGWLTPQGKPIFFSKQEQQLYLKLNDKRVRSGGYEVLLWLPEHMKFATFFFSKASWWNGPTYCSVETSEGKGGVFSREQTAPADALFEIRTPVPVEFYITSKPGKGKDPKGNLIDVTYHSANIRKIAIEKMVGEPPAKEQLQTAWDDFHARTPQVEETSTINDVRER